MEKKLPNSIRKNIRFKKARIHREVLNLKEQERLIDELYKSFAQQKNEELLVKKSEKGKVSLSDAK
ncbi:MAG: hypothetical protein A2Z68_02625 [Candidatus Nealsonbacteria bacterium RBG_13_38_11]|uniref:Uncharacterized protein n=1 Tax=Candidatus Nealsonbacteria bacterium RBG_13_38_11 TaxID=1801662 RepID=A0A1G2DZC0_9BACT|nr:MAG: hypothetical protein A2Z68_02625 [Candidatus Nealsonbacteria bacterium RBG_13_38_11]